MKSYLPGLNTARLYAAFCVVVAHVRPAQMIPGILNGAEAVTLFFVLSGYLITYRLLKETCEKGSFNLKQFYIRRELRILPLYYSIFILGAFILPLLGAQIVPSETVVFTAFLLPQVPFGFYPLISAGMISHLWSIGTEEFFYILFPALLKRIPIVVLSLLVIIASVEVERYGYSIKASWTGLAVAMRFQCMAIGALGAWLVSEPRKILRIIHHPITQIMAIAGLLSVMITHINPFYDLVFSACTVIFLINISTNPLSLIRLEWAWSKRLGELTYGIYMYHYPMVWIMQHWFSGAALLISVIVLTVGVAWLSYTYFEQPIMRLGRSKNSAHETTFPLSSV